MSSHARVGWTVVGVSLVLMALASPSAAELGCLSDPGNTPPSFATCTANEDCAPVGGIGCTSDICFCDTGSLSPFCACASASPPLGAPVLSAPALIGLVLLLSAVGLFGLRRRTGRRRDVTA